MQAMTDDTRTHIILAFMNFSFFEEELNESTINTYISGIKHFMKIYHKDHCIYFDHVLIVMMKKALVIYQRKRNELQASKRKLPFTLDMLYYLLDSNILNIDVISHRAVFTSMYLAFIMLLRISEYTSTNSNHCILTTDVKFWINNNTSYVHCSELDHITKEMISAVSITLRSAKNDQNAMGHVSTFSNSNLNNRGFNLALLLFIWCKHYAPKHEAPLFGNLSSNDINYYVKKAADGLNLPSTNVTTHSIRIGGATSLTAQNTPSHIIKKIGRWKGDSYQIYTQMSSEVFNQVEHTLTGNHALTSKHVIMSIPVTNNRKA